VRATRAGLAGSLPIPGISGRTCNLLRGRYQVNQLFFSLYVVFPICPVETALEKLNNPGKGKLLKYPTSAPDVSCTLWMLAVVRTFGALTWILGGCLAIDALDTAYDIFGQGVWQAEFEAEVFASVGLIAVFLPLWIISCKYRPKASCVTTADR
jgi:hypothetical protein